MKKPVWFWIFAGMVLAMLVTSYPNVGDDYDVWWLLRYGRFFIENLSWRPDHTLYSWTPVNADWHYVTWLGDVVLYAVYQTGGFALLNVLQWLIFLMVAGLTAWAARRGGGRFDWPHLAALLCAGIAINPVAAYVKPELFTVLFFALTACIYFESKRTGGNWFYWYPLLFLVWVNTHGGFINGGLLLGVVWLGEGVAGWRSLTGAMPRRQWMHFTAALALTGFAVCVNPYGIWYPLGIIKGLLGGLWVSHVRTVSAYTTVWSYLFPSRPVFRLMNMAWMLVWMGVVAAGGLIWLRRRLHFVDAALTAVLAIFFVYAFTMARAGIYFALLWPFALVRMDQVSGLAKKRPVQFASKMVLCSLTILLLYQAAAVNTYDSWFGSRIENWTPVNECAAIRRHKMPGPLFNDYLTGGYLVWDLFPDYKVFIDPRYGPYEATGIWDEYLALINARDMPGAWMQFCAEYQFNTVLLRGGRNFRLMDAILASPAWRLVFFDRVAAVFVRAELAPVIWTACRPEMTPEKFAAVTNPAVLFYAFYLYCNYYPPAASRIYAIYQKNVRPWYQGRVYHLERMAALLKETVSQ